MAEQFSFDALTMDELIAIEEVSGVSLTQLESVMADQQTPKGKMFKVVAWIVGRRDNPELTYAEAGKMPVKVVMDALRSPADEGADPESRPFVSAPTAAPPG